MQCDLDVVDCVVAGAGVVGLAVARALARTGREVIVAEAATAPGTATSSRNSEVIHAGLYYPPGSLKARLCFEGRRKLYAYCAERGIEHRCVGKLIVASSPDQQGELDALEARARACGVDDLQRLCAAEVRALEPALHCHAATWSPSTGIVDSHALMLALLADAEAAGAVLAVASPVLGGEADGDGLRLSIGGAAPFELRCRIFVNAAGHAAPRLARSLSGLDRDTVPAAYRCKGNYFVMPGRAAFSHLIYPVPEAAGLGVHVTLDLAGQMRFGPDVEWLDEAEDAAFDYRVDPRRAAAFEAAVRRYWPALPAGALVPAYAGVRPKITPPGATAADFRIDGPEVHGLPGAVMLYGIESPGLTACLAIADEVVSRLQATG